MTNWEDMTEAQREEANELAYAQACDRLRGVVYRHPDADMQDVRKIAEAELNAEIKSAQDDIKHGQRTRATRMDKRSAEYAKTTIEKLGLIQGFIWDAEI